MIDVSELWEEANAAIGRLYYAVYHAAAPVVGVDGAAAGSNHDRLLQAMKRSRDVNWARAATRYDSLKRARVRADYFLGDHVTRHDVLSAVHHAAAVRTLLGLAGPGTRDT